MPGVGDCATVTVPVDEATALLVARSGDPFTSEELLLLRGMGRVLAQALRMLRALAVLQERQTLLERLFRIQRSISHRLPIGEVLDSITQGAAELLGDDAATLRILDEDDPTCTVLLSNHGLDPAVVRTVQRSGVDQGIAGQAITGGRLVIAEDYGAYPQAHAELLDNGVRSAMAAP